MPKKDVNQLAKHIVDLATGEKEEQRLNGHTHEEVASKGGRSRAEKLTPSQRKKIATNAAKKRWGKS